jgi:hypothetical protein
VQAAKRESLSRVASPSVQENGAPAGSENLTEPALEKTVVAQEESVQDVQMSAAPELPAVPKVSKHEGVLVRFFLLIFFLFSLFLQSPWIPELAAMFDQVEKISPAACEIMGWVLHLDYTVFSSSPALSRPAFYLTFWQLSLYDISPPTEQYHQHVQTLRDLSAKEDKEANLAERSADRARRAAALVHKSRRSRYNDFIAALSSELKEQAIARQYTIKRLNREKAHWFIHSMFTHELSDWGLTNLLAIEQILARHHLWPPL